MLTLFFEEVFFMKSCHEDVTHGNCDVLFCRYFHKYTFVFVENFSCFLPIIPYSHIVNCCYTKLLLITKYCAIQVYDIAI